MIVQTPTLCSTNAIIKYTCDNEPKTTICQANGIDKGYGSPRQWEYPSNCTMRLEKLEYGNISWNCVWIPNRSSPCLEQFIPEKLFSAAPSE